MLPRYKRAHPTNLTSHTIHTSTAFTQTPSHQASTMAYYQEVDYCSEEVRSVDSPAGFGRHHGGGGVQQRVVKEKFEEVDTVSRTGGGHHHGHHQGQHHGHGVVVREVTRVEEDFNTCTGELHERKESFVVRSY